MAYEAKNYDHLLGLEGMSETLLKNHFTLYQGYVKNANGLLEKLDTLEVGSAEYGELQRRFGWEWNGMRLHEFYFSNLKSGGSECAGPIKEKIESIYGSIENWRKNFVGVGTMRGIGWVILYLDVASGELFNTWINEHDVGHLSGAMPLLVMDVFEHAYMVDYGLKKADYIEAFMHAIDWDEVNRRLALVTHL